MDYDFKSLNDKDFEILAADLLSLHLGQHVERFKAGKDQGIDGRFFHNGEKVIVQAKHWVKTGLARLIKDLEKEEAEKVRTLNPKRYIFVTSLELSHSNKTKIREIFHPYIHSDSDVIGNEDLNDFLRRYPQVEKNHYKLWLKSSGALSNLLNAGIHGRSRHILQEISDQSDLYVITSNHRNAMQRLEDLHSVIITGAPGVGKTFLANQLCQYYAAKGYEFLFIESSMNEAESAYREEEEQVFYFDDFLGRNFILALNPHQDSQVTNFIRRVSRDPKKRFILTSRSNILNQGKRLSELFEINKIERNEYELSISELTSLDKAAILYNHIWFGDLSEQHIDEIYINRRYRDIIEHKNFNPRIIAFITDDHRISELSPSLYWGYIRKTLANPKDIWRNVLEVQLDDACRHIVTGLSLNGAEMTDEALRDFFHRLRKSNFAPEKTKSYDENMRILTGALINRNIKNESNVFYNLFNPSIADFVIANYLGDFDYVKEIYVCLRTRQSIKNLTSLSASNTIKKEDYRKLIEILVLRLSISSGHDAAYEMALLAAASKAKPVAHKIINHMSAIASNRIKNDTGILSEDFFYLVLWALQDGTLNLRIEELAEKVNGWLDEGLHEQDQFILLSRIASIIDDDPQVISERIKDLYIDFLSENITDMATESGVLDNFYSYEDYYKYELIDFIESELSSMAIDFDRSDAETIAYYCDTDSIISSNIESARESEAEVEYHLENRLVNETVDDPIDDLFDRNR